MLNTYTTTLAPSHTYRIHFLTPSGRYASEDIASSEQDYEDSYADALERFQRANPRAEICEVALVA